MRPKKIIGISVTILLLAGCATISEDKCAAGNWTDIGYKDGLNGTERTRLSAISETCAEYGYDVNRKAYLTAYEQGLDSYCVPDRFYSLGRGGSSYNEVCSPRDDGMLRSAYEEGREIYQIESERERLINRVETLEDEFYDVRDRIADPETPADERDRLRKKRDRLEEDLDNARYDLRAHERQYGRI